MIILLPLLVIGFCLSVDFFMLTNLINLNIFPYILIFSFLLGYFSDYIHYKKYPNDKVIDDNDLID
jgi:hypothetical protein